MRVLSKSYPTFLPSRSDNLGCPVCDQRRHAYLFVVHGLPIVRCPGCGLISLAPQHEHIDFDSFYGENLNKEDPGLLWSDSATERDATRRYLRVLQERGLGDGQILLIAPPDHVFAEVASVEGFHIHKHVSIRDLEDGMVLDGPFDAAVVIYQLEKSLAPDDILRRISGALAPRGVLLLTIPNVNSEAARFFGSRWTEWRPENRFYFDKATIQLLLEKSGFSEVWTEPDRRLYTLEHIHDRATAFPRTALTRVIAQAYRSVPPQLRNRRVRLASSGLIVTATRSALRQQPLCSIIVPAYNERETIATLLEALLPKQLVGMDKEVIIVESNSTDGTRELVMQYQAHPEVKVVLEDRPQGKGHAVRAGLALVRGDIIMIQDADLEYDLNDYDSLLAPVLAFEVPFVLGKRHGMSWKMRQFTDQPFLASLLNIGHVFFTTFINVLYRQRMEDPFTMYKVFRRDCLHGLEFECSRFDFDVELVTKLLRKGYRPLEIPVNYRSRSFNDGKKVSVLRDPLTWLWAGLKYRLAPMRRRQH